MARGAPPLQGIRQHARVLAGLDDVQALLGQVGNARFVLMGEATHGTAEFYRMRAALSQRLVAEFGFDAVVAEADWPSALRASRYAQGGDDDETAAEALDGFERFPRWMWANTEIVRWLDWLRDYNASLGQGRDPVGFYGLDLYSLHESMQAVLQYLDRADPEAAARARARYACFDELASNPQAYGHAVNYGLREDCEREVLQQLRELCGQAWTRLRHDRVADVDELFYAQQNARVVRNAETYYRTMFGGREDSWNLRDTHMADTLQQLDAHLSRRRGRPARLIAWAHNSHVGDARATDSARRGQLNLGQLMRERCADPAETFLLGFTTHTGTVAAADDWDAPVELKRVLPSRHDSIERVLHDSGLDRFVLPLRDCPDELRQGLAQPRLQRAIGVVYRPDTERWSHYFDACLARQFDAVIHLDTTSAVRPLQTERPWEHTPEPQTYPTAL